MVNYRTKHQHCTAFQVSERTALIMLLLLFLFLSPAFAQDGYKSQCLSGDCKNGYGLLQTGMRSYEAGQFSKGQLHGEGIRIVFPMQNAALDLPASEKRFLKEAAQKGQLVTDPVSYQAVSFYQGNFIKGTLHGRGRSMVNEKKEVIAKRFGGVIDNQLLAGNVPFTAVYEGEFVNNEPQLSGTLRLENKLMILEYPAGQMENMSSDHSGMYSITVKQTGEKGYYNGVVTKGNKNGWFITNIRQLELVFENGADKVKMKIDSVFFRSLYLEDELVGSTSPGIYPLDEASSIHLVLPNGETYYGPVDNENQSNGFGMVSRQGKDNKGNPQKRYSYIGYFVNGKKEGLGELRTYFNNEISAWQSGQFRQDTLRKGYVIYAGATVRKKDPHQKSKEIIDYTEYAYLKGDLRLAKQVGGPQVYLLDTYGETGKFRKFAHTNNNITIERYVGFVDADMKYHGRGQYSNLVTNLQQEGEFVNGRLRTGSSTFNAEGLGTGWVVEHNGQKVYVASIIYPGGQRILSDGSTAVGAYKVLGFKGEGFRCACPNCDGTGESSTRVNVPITEHSWTRDVQTVKAVPYLNAEWQGITKVTTGYKTGGYSYNQKQMCKMCSGNGYYYCKTTLP